MKIIVESKKTEFLTFMKYKDSEKKTYDISVLNKNSDTLLGKIKWYGPWRQYALHTLDNIIFDRKCMNDIISYIDKLMDDRKKASELENL